MDTATCPLCGQPNHCGMLQDPNAPCWCFSTDMPAGLETRLPEPERQRACICSGCAALPIGSPTSIC